MCKGFFSIKLDRWALQLQVEWEWGRHNVTDVWTELSVIAAVAKVYESDSWSGYDNDEDQSPEDNNTKWIVMLCMATSIYFIMLIAGLLFCSSPIWIEFIGWQNSAVVTDSTTSERFTMSIETN